MSLTAAAQTPSLQWQPPVQQALRAVMADCARLASDPLKLGIMEQPEQPEQQSLKCPAPQCMLNLLIWQVFNGKGLSPGSKVCADHDRLLSLAAVPRCKLGDGLFAPVQGHVTMVAASGQISLLQVNK